MEIIVAISLAALVLLGSVKLTLPGSDRKDRLTVRDIQARLAAETLRTYTPIDRGW